MLTRKLRRVRFIGILLDKNTLGVSILEKRISAQNDFDELINKFIVKQEKEIEILKKIFSKIGSYARIYSDGEIEFLRKKLTVKDKIFLVILTRYLAVKINQLKNEELVKNVSEITELNEIARTIGKTPKQVSARLSELEKEGFVRKIGKGKYTIASLNKALEYLKELEKEVDKIG